MVIVQICSRVQNKLFLRMREYGFYALHTNANKARLKIIVRNIVYFRNFAVLSLFIFPYKKALATLLQWKKNTTKKIIFANGAMYKTSYILPYKTQDLTSRQTKFFLVNSQKC